MYNATNYFFNREFLRTWERELGRNNTSFNNEATDLSIIN